MDWYRQPLRYVVYINLDLVQMFLTKLLHRIFDWNGGRLWLVNTGKQRSIMPDRKIKCHLLAVLVFIRHFLQQFDCFSPKLSPICVGLLLSPFTRCPSLTHFSTFTQLSPLVRLSPLTRLPPLSPDCPLSSPRHMFTPSLRLSGHQNGYFQIRGVYGLVLMAQRLVRRDWRSGGPRFKSHPRLTSQSWPSYQLNQLGSKAASDSTLKQLTTCGVSNTCTLLWEKWFQTIQSCRTIADLYGMVDWYIT